MNLQRFRVLRLDRSSFKLCRQLKYETCCLCAQQGQRSFLIVQTVTEWGKWADRFLCQSCAINAAEFSQAVEKAIRPAQVAIATPLNPQIEEDVLDAAQAFQKPVTACQIRLWLNARKMPYSEPEVLATLRRLSDRGLAQEVEGKTPHWTASVEVAA